MTTYEERFIHSFIHSFTISIVILSVRPAHWQSKLNHFIKISQCFTVVSLDKIL